MHITHAHAYNKTTPISLLLNFGPAGSEKQAINLVWPYRGMNNHQTQSEKSSSDTIIYQNSPWTQLTWPIFSPADII